MAADTPKPPRMWRITRPKPLTAGMGESGEVEERIVVSTSKPSGPWNGDVSEITDTAGVEPHDAWKAVKATAANSEKDGK